MAGIYAPDGSYRVTVVGGGGGGTSEVEVTNFPATQDISGEVTISGTVPVSGPLTNAQLRASAVPVSGPVTEDELTAVVGLLNAGAYSDDTGAADGSVIGLLKGIYVQNAAIISLLTQIETNTSA